MEKNCIKNKSSRFPAVLTQHSQYFSTFFHHPTAANFSFLFIKGFDLLLYEFWFVKLLYFLKI